MTHTSNYLYNSNNINTHTHTHTHTHTICLLTQACIQIILYTIIALRRKKIMLRT